jgi:hypothetical protein
MRRASVISLDEELAHLAARLGLKHKWPWRMPSSTRRRKLTMRPCIQDDDFGECRACAYVRK